MKLVSPTSAFGVVSRLVIAAMLVAVVAVGAPLHSHDVALDGDQPSPQKAPCAACVTGASPGLVLERTDVVPRLEAIDVVSVSECDVVRFSFRVRPGRAPPVV